MTYYATGRPKGRPSQQQEIIYWLRGYIESGPGGMRSAARIEVEGAQRKYNLKALKRAKKALGFVSVRVGGLGSDGDWLWANPTRLNQDQSITQQLSEKLDRHERRIIDGAATSKAQSRARIANGWLEKITEELFGQGKTLEEIREHSAKQDPYLTDKNFADMEEEFQISASSKLIELNRAKQDADEYLQKQVGLILTGRESEADMRKAQDLIKTAEDRLETLSKQIGPVIFRKLTMGQQAA